METNGFSNILWFPIKARVGGVFEDYIIDFPRKKVMIEVESRIVKSVPEFGNFDFFCRRTLISVVLQTVHSCYIVQR